jgi:hypothetical protein
VNKQIYNTPILQQPHLNYLYEVSQGSHYVANGPDDKKGGLINGEVGRVVLSWLEVYLIGDTGYRPLLFNVPKSASRYEKNLE